MYAILFFAGILILFGVPALLVAITTNQKLAKLDNKLTSTLYLEQELGYMLIR